MDIVGSFTGLLLITITVITLLILVVGAVFMYKLVKKTEILESSLKFFESTLKDLSGKPGRINKTGDSGDKTIHELQKGVEEQHWLDAIGNIQDDDELKLEYLEAASKRFPWEKGFIIQIRNILMPLAKKGTPDDTESGDNNPSESHGLVSMDENNSYVRREALKRLRDHANRFSEHCEIDDLPYALDFKKEVLHMIEDVMVSLDKSRYNHIERLLQEMESDIKKLQNNPSDTGLLDKIEKDDQRMDKQLLSNNPSLQVKYDRLSLLLKQILVAADEDSKSVIRKLNIKALLDGKKVLDRLENSFQKGYKDYIPGSSKQIDPDKLDLEMIARLLSRHDPDNLLPTTLNYLRTAEAEVFGKLSPEGKIKFTELMIQESLK